MSSLTVFSFCRVQLTLHVLLLHLLVPLWNILLVGCVFFIFVILPGHGTHKFVYAAVAISCGVMENGAVILDTNKAEEQVEKVLFPNCSVVEAKYKITTIDCSECSFAVPLNPFAVEILLNTNLWCFCFSSSVATWRFCPHMWDWSFFYSPNSIWKQTDSNEIFCSQPAAIEIFCSLGVSQFAQVSRFEGTETEGWASWTRIDNFHYPWSDVWYGLLLSCALLYQGLVSLKQL